MYTRGRPSDILWITRVSRKASKPEVTASGLGELLREQMGCTSSHWGGVGRLRQQKACSYVRGGARSWRRGRYTLTLRNLQVRQPVLVRRWMGSALTRRTLKALEALLEPELGDEFAIERVRSVS